MGDPTLAEWAAAAGAFFTAVAAIAALWTARQGRHLIEAAGRPGLEVQVLRNTSGLLTLSIINAGPGLARTATFAAHAMGKRTDNIIGDGFLPAGDGVQVITAIGPLPPAGASFSEEVPDLGVVVSCRDASGYVHHRTHRGTEWVPKTLVRRRPAYPDSDAVFRKLLPEVDLDAAAWVGHTPATPRP